MKNKQIIILIGIIFLAFVGYKLIASNIQENKEKTVLQEKARLEEVAKEPLNKCLEDIDKETERNINILVDTNTMSPEEYKSCIDPNTNHGLNVKNLVASGKLTLEEYCKPLTNSEVDIEKQKIYDNARIEKEDCYKQYK